MPGARTVSTSERYGGLSTGTAASAAATAWLVQRRGMERYEGHPDLAITFARQRGLITRRQALDTGMSGPLVDGLVRMGHWVPVRRGVYMPADVWAALDPYDGQPRARARAAHLTMRATHVLSHESAARELGL